MVSLIGDRIDTIVNKKKKNKTKSRQKRTNDELTSFKVVVTVTFDFVVSLYKHTARYAIKMTRKMFITALSPSILVQSKILVR